MNEADERSRAAEASRWFTVVTNPSITVEDLHGFRDWRTDPANAAAFEKVERMWGQAKGLADRPAIRAATDAALARRPSRTDPRAPYKLPAFVGAAASITVLGVATFAVLRAQPPTYETAVGSQRLEQLVDGSRVRLNTNSKVEIQFSETERRVRLVRGEAFFDVAHDAARPFVVEANGTRVRALGTKFDIHRAPTATQVTLVEGRVQVRQAGRDAAATLAPNQSVTVSAKGISAPRPVDALRATEWTTGRLTFSGVPLHAAVAEMNRYTTRKIVVTAPDAVTSELVSGQFSAGDTENFVAALGAVYGLKVTSRDRREIRLAPG